jgi:hypothetical protein
MLYENYTPEGQGMAKKQGRRSAVISGLPASQMEIAAQAAKEDFQQRTLATKQQAYADQQANITGGIEGLSQLAGTQYKNRALDDKQAQRLQMGPAGQAGAGMMRGAAQTPQPAPTGVGEYNPMAGGPYRQPPQMGGPQQNFSEPDLVMELMRMLYGGAY